LDNGKTGTKLKAKKKGGLATEPPTGNSVESERLHIQKKKVNSEKLIAMTPKRPTTKETQDGG